MSTLVTRIGDLTTRIATEIKGVKATVGSTSSLNTSAKNSLVSALNEVLALANQAVSAAGATIDDSATASTTKTYSVSKIVDLINGAINQLTNGAPGALDTLDELAAALGDDSNFAATVAAKLSTLVSFNAPQSLTTAQKAQAKANIDALGTAELGDPDTNYVTLFNSGLA